MIDISLLNKYRKNDLFIIAEAGTNHQGDIIKAKQFVKLAARAGCSAIKFQHVIASELVHPQTGMVDLPGGNIPLFETFKKIEQPKKFFEEIMRYCHLENILFLCSPFGTKSAQDLEDIGVEAYKVASPESNYYPLHEQLKQYQKYIFISTGVCTERDVLDIILYYNSTNPYSLIHCVTHYPAPPENYNLLSLLSYRKWMKCKQWVGLSDHTLDAFFIPRIAHYLSMRLQDLFILEKHITLDPHGGGLDDTIAINAQQLVEMVSILKKQSCTISQKTGSNRYNNRSKWNKEDLEKISHFDKKTFLSWKTELANDIADLLMASPSRIFKCLGNWGKHLSPHEKTIYPTTNRSLRAIKGIKKGEHIKHDNSRYLRSERNLKPGLSLRDGHLINNLKATRTIIDGEEINWENASKT